MPRLCFDFNCFLSPLEDSHCVSRKVNSSSSHTQSTPNVFSNQEDQTSLPRRGQCRVSPPWQQGNGDFPALLKQEPEGELPLSQAS